MTKMGMKRTDPKKPMNQISKKQAIKNYNYNKTILRLIFTRAGGKCEKCGSVGDFRGLSGHHIKKRRYQDDSPENLIILCGKCHSEEEHIREV